MIKKILKIWVAYFVTAYTVYGISVNAKESIIARHNQHKQRKNGEKVKPKYEWVVISAMKNFKDVISEIIDWSRDRDINE